MIPPTRPPFTRWFFLGASIVLLLYALAHAAPAGATVLTSCGALTRAGGPYTLEADLDCGAWGSLTLDGAWLDLQGHTLRCHRYFGPCIRLTGWGARLSSGTVTGNAAYAVAVAGTGGHYLSDLDIGISEGTLDILSHWNLLVRVHVHSFRQPAITVRGSANWLASSTAQCPTTWTSCLDIGGHYNAVTWNLVTVETVEHFRGTAAVSVTGHFNWLARNIVTDVDGVSLRVSGHGNVLANNRLLTLVEDRSVATDLDAEDTNGDCTHNTWVQNVGLSASPACLTLQPLPQNAQR